jgi:hypothetical protein
MKMQISVMPAWIAGIQVRRMRPERSMSACIPALHAGMTMRGLRSTIESLEWLIFEREA